MYYIYPKDSLYLREELHKILKTWKGDPHFRDVTVTNIVELFDKWVACQQEGNTCPVG